MVGQRERVVVVEVQGQWLVLGVTAQNVNLLSSFPRPAEADAMASPSPVFAEWLTRALRRRDGVVPPDGAPEKK
jgi:flagellar protein FliO/FliZ